MLKIVYKINNAKNKQRLLRIHIKAAILIIFLLEGYTNEG